MILIVAMLSGLVAGLALAQPADWIVENAAIHTGNEKQPRATAMAIRDGRFIAVGSDLGAWKGPRTKVTDARGAALIPGFIDSHVHLRGLGDSLAVLDLREAKSSGGIAGQVKAAAASRPAGEWILGRGWDQTRWPGGEFPTGSELSDAAPNHPVLLRRVDGHAAWVNRKALELADVNAATPDPAGGKIHRDAQGRPTGVLIDRAIGLVSRRIPDATPEQVRARIERAAGVCARLGLTTVHDAGIDAADLEAFRALIAEGRLPVRVYAMIGGERDLWRTYLARGPEKGPFLTVRSIKLMADGALGSRGAALAAPYDDDPANRGLMILARQDIERVSRAAVKAGFQVNTHAIGDLANRVALDAYAAALGGDRTRRFRMEHAQVVAAADADRFARLGVIASMQATHATSDMRWAEKRVGPKRVEGAYAWQWFLKRGVVVANGSDFPVEDPNPLWGFYASVTRQDHAGYPEGGWRSGERMSRQEALRSWTWAGAYAAFEEDTKGTIEVGKVADFLMLSRDIMTIPAPEILETKVTMTVVNGKPVYQEGR